MQICGADGKATDALASGAEDSVGDGGGDGRDAGFADAARAFGAGNDVDVDNLWSIGHTENFVVVEVALVDAAVGDGDFTFEGLREAEGGDPMGTARTLLQASQLPKQAAQAVDLTCRPR